MTRPPLSSDDEGVEDPDDECMEDRDEFADDELREEREPISHPFAGPGRPENLVANITDEQHVRALLSEARSRDDWNEPSLDSNYEYVLERIDELDEPILEEVCRTHESTEYSETRSEDNAERSRLALIVDDDYYVAREYGLMLSAAGIKVMYASGVDEALSIVNHLGDAFSFIVVDIRMPVGDSFSSYESGGGIQSGVLLASEILEVCYSAKVIALSNSDISLDVAWFAERQSCFFCHKSEFPPERFLKFIKVNIMKDFSALKTFIIHGHDKVAALGLKNYLQNRLGFSEPTILAEKKSGGRTIIEKFEHYFADADLVFALFTPDDFVAKPKTSKRARQNVIFEFGYALGMLGRKSGRVFYLYKGDVEIPSDLAGVVYIDISNGIESAGEEIRVELEGWLP